MKDKLGGNFMIEFAALKPKAYSCLIDDSNSDKKAMRTKNM